MDSILLGWVHVEDALSSKHQASKYINIGMNANLFVKLFKEHS